MLIKRKLIPFILCVIMLIPLIGCSEAQQTAIESISVPETENASNSESSDSASAKYDTAVSEEESETTGIIKDENGYFMVEPGMDENIPSVEELILNDYDLILYPFDETIKNGWSSNEEHFITFAKDTVFRSNGYNLENGQFVQQSADILFEGNITDYTEHSSSAHIASDDKIMVILYDGQIRTLYTSPDGEKVTSIAVRKNYIYFVEGGYLYIMTYDGSDIKEICEIGYATRILPVDSNTVYFTRFFYNDEWICRTAYFDSIDEKGNFLNDNAIEFEDITTEYFLLELATKEITQLSETDYHIGYHIEGEKNESKPKA